MTTYTDELNQLDELFSRYKLMTVTDYARSNGKTRQGIYQAIKRGSLPVIELGGVTFIIAGML